MFRGVRSILRIVPFALVFLLAACTQQPQPELAPMGSDNAAEVLKLDIHGIWAVYLLTDPPIFVGDALIEGKVRSVNGQVRGESDLFFDNINEFIGFPDLLDAERIMRVDCMNALDNNTLLITGEVITVGRIQLFPPGLWGAFIVEDRDGLPDRFLGAGAGDQETMLELCANAETVVPTIVPDQEELATTGGLEITVKRNRSDNE